MNLHENQTFYTINASPITERAIIFNLGVTFDNNVILHFILTMCTLAHDVNNFTGLPAGYCWIILK